MTTFDQKYVLKPEYEEKVVGFKPNSSEVLTLNEVIAGSPVEPFDFLTPDRRVDLVKRSLSNRTDFCIFSLGGDYSGKVNLEKALEEVSKGSALGEKIVKIEGRIMMTLLRRYVIAEQQW